MELTTQSYGFLLVVFFLVGLVILEKAPIWQKLLVALFFSIFMSILISGIMFVMGLFTIDAAQHKDFSDRLVQLKNPNSELTVVQKKKLIDWVECSNSNGKISSFEYETFIRTYDGFLKTNSISNQAIKTKAILENKE